MEVGIYCLSSVLKLKSHGEALLSTSKKDILSDSCISIYEASFHCYYYQYLPYHRLLFLSNNDAANFALLQKFALTDITALAKVYL